MTNDLAQAYHGVYTSSGEIMKNKQRHLYVNMLDLLTRTTRASAISASFLLTEQYVRFWYTEILPLAFDEDKIIQDNAIAALETVLPHLEAVAFQNLPEWPGIKATIVDEYSRKLHDLRQAPNSNWYKIWCLLVRILNKEILKGATIINTFLQIVELGFRSSDYNIRAEAFLCWKVLVEIFVMHNEINSPKRIKLISIPLKSSQSKTLETSVNKFKVWWYFICKLSGKIEDYLDTIYEPFLVFCFGPACKQQPSVSAPGQGNTYTIVTQMAVACLIDSMGSSGKETASLMNTMGLERISAPIINRNIMSKCGKVIVNACFEATLMAGDCNGSTYTKQLETLWKNLFEQLANAESLDLYQECLKKLRSISQNQNSKHDNILRQHIFHVMELFVDPNRFPFSNEANNVNTVALCEIFALLTELITQNDLILPADFLDRITKIYGLQSFLNTPKYWHLQKNIIQSIMNNSIMQRTVKLNLWKNVSKSLADYLKRNLFEFRVEENAKIINDWILWPLENNLVELPGVEGQAAFFFCWKVLIEAASHAEGKSNFVQKLVVPLRNLFDSDGRTAVFFVVFGYFITSLDNNFDESSQPTAAFDLIRHVLSTSPRSSEENFTIIIESLTLYIKNLQENQIILAFKDLKSIFATILEKEKANFFTKRSADEFKRSFQDKLKSNKAREKKLLKEIKDLMNNDGMFVIIPTVWGMNPDKLTEHQKEKMAEKRNDIPALYNDMSQSQDNSIKAWTPKKIVIAKSKDVGEIVIENNRNDDDDIVMCTEIQSNRNAPTSEMNGHNDLTKCVEENNVNSGLSSNLTNDKETNETVQKSSPNEEKKIKKTIRSNESERILNQLNIKVDEEKKSSLLRQLKSIEIDTVEGNTVVKGKLRERRKSGKQNESIIKRKSLNHNVVNANKRSRINNKKDESIEEKKVDVSTMQEEIAARNDPPASNESTDEIIENSQVSEPVLLKKSATRKSLISNILKSPVKNQKNELTKEEVTDKETHPQSLPEEPHHEINQADRALPNLEPKNNNETSVFIASQNNNAVEKVNENVKISEMDTLTNTELLDISLCSASPNKAVRSPPKLAITAPKGIEITEQNTQPYTEQSSVIVDQINDVAVSDIQLSLEVNENQNKTNDSNQSIRSSPELQDVGERNVEFLNNTLNISPILNGTGDVDNSDNIIQPEMKTPSSPVGRKLAKPSVQLQLSPPERKSTVTVESPAHRPKATPQFTGRGAQLINLIRNKRVECVPRQQSALMTAKTDEKVVVEQAHQGQYPQQSSPKSEQAPPTNVHNELLVFSKVLPSPYASPSASILKRKLRCDSLDDIESPLSKRKRVSFHDPPVSATKEYLKHFEEDKTKPSLNRCLLPDRTSTPTINNFKNNSFKRKSRVDSMVEIARFSDPPAQTNFNFGSSNQSTIQLGQTTADMDTLKWNNTTNESSHAEIDEACLTSSPSLYFADENAALKHILEKYPLETLLEKYSEMDKGLTNKSVRAVTKEISSLMSKDPKAKTNVLEILSEQHPHDFLEHAVQENLSFVVCDRLNYSSIVEFICEKSKLNEDCRRVLFERIQTMLAVDRLNADAQQLILSLLKNHRMTDQEIVTCMDLILSRHRQNNLAAPVEATQ